jgi:threonine dehydratase
MKIDCQSIDQAAERFAGAIRRTPLIRSLRFEERLGVKHPVYFKAENLQHTGSFKLRGSLQKILSIQTQAKQTGVITASAGNHGQGVAYHCQRLGIKATIVMPLNTPFVKANATRRMGAEVIFFGESYQEAFQEAVRLQKERGLAYVHAFDDPEIIIGQGTVAKEIWEDLPEIEVFVCPIGGGGLLAGAGTYLKEKNPKLKLVALQAEGSSNFLPSLKAGQPITLERVNTIAEGIAVKRMGDLPFDLCRNLVDETILVSDDAIAEGLLWILENEKLFVEGCGGASIAAVAKKPGIVTGPTVVLLSGGNLDVNLLAKIIERGLSQSGRRTHFEATIPDVPGSLQRLIQVIAEQRASIIEVDHERMFSRTNLKEVNTHLIVETDGFEHIERLKAALAEKGLECRFF